MSLAYGDEEGAMPSSLSQSTPSGQTHILMGVGGVRHVFLEDIQLRERITIQCPP